MQIEVMVTETWSYFHSQLDRARKIKAHVLKPGTSRSYCGLQNHDDVGEMSWQEFLNLGVDACSRCRHLTQLAPEKWMGELKDAFSALDDALGGNDADVESDEEERENYPVQYAARIISGIIQDMQKINAAEHSVNQTAGSLAKK